MDAVWRCPVVDAARRLLRNGTASIYVQATKVGLFVQVYGLGHLAVDGENGPRLLPRFDGYVWVDGQAERTFPATIWGDYLRSEPGYADPWRLEVLTGTLFGRRVCFRLQHLLPHGTIALRGTQVFCDVVRNRDEMRGGLLRALRPLAKQRTRAFLRAYTKGRKPQLSALPRELVEMIVAKVPLPFDE